MGVDSKMLKSELCISYDTAIGQMCNAKINRSMSNLPVIRIDSVDEENDEDLGYNNVPHRNNPVIARRSSYKSVLPKKLSRFQAQVSQISPQESCEKLSVGGREKKGRRNARGRDNESRSKVCRSKVRWREER